MIMDVSFALDGWEQTVILKTVTKTSVNFVETVTVTGVDYLAVVQPTVKTKLNADSLDWSRAHITTHGKGEIKLGQFVEYKGRDYKVVECGDWSDYGYYEAVCEDTMTDKMTITPPVVTP